MFTRILRYFVLFVIAAVAALQSGSLASIQASDLATLNPASQPAYDSASWVYTGGPLGCLAKLTLRSCKNYGLKFLQAGHIGTKPGWSATIAWSHLPPIQVSIRLPLPLTEKPISR
jgi:hypothetical protein